MLTNYDIFDVGGGGVNVNLIFFYLAYLYIFCDNHLTLAVTGSVGHGLERVEEGGEGGDGGHKLHLEAVGLGHQDIQQRDTRLTQEK